MQRACRSLPAVGWNLGKRHVVGNTASDRTRNPVPRDSAAAVLNQLLTGNSAIVGYRFEMSENPLHCEPTRPLVDGEGTLINPIGDPPFVQLDDDQPIAYDDLRPSTAYVSHGFEYITDASAMPARVRGVLRFVPLHQRVRHNVVQRTVGHKGAGPDDLYHGGHIVAVSLGGFASGPNLFPQAGNFNTGAFARLESSWREALREGCSVEVDIALAEGDDPETPSFVVVTHWESGVEETLALLNEGHVL